MQALYQSYIKSGGAGFGPGVSRDCKPTAGAPLDEIFHYATR